MQLFKRANRLMLLVALATGTLTVRYVHSQNAPTTTPAPVYSAAQVTVYFSPRGGATEAIVREINEAKKSIAIQAYSFTSVPIAKAILEAQKRGVTVQAVLDKSNQTSRYSAATFLDNAGIPVLIDHKPGIAHSKVIIIDSSSVLTGSFNFSQQAEERNVENLLILKNAPEIVKAYEANLRARAAESKPYLRPTATRPTQAAANTDTEADTDAAASANEVKSSPDNGSSTGVTVAGTSLLNLNIATQKQLEALPGIGKVTAQRIVEYRTQNGGFKSVDDLMKVSGIGQATLEKVRPLVTVKSPGTDTKP